MNRNKAWLAWALSVGLVAYLLGAATASRSTVDADQTVKAYASGTALHVDALQAGPTGPRVADVEAAFSAVNVDADGFTETSRQNENELLVQPTPPDPEAEPDPDEPVAPSFVGKNASARGSGIELGLGDDIPSAARSVIEETKSQATAPPDFTESKDLGPVPGGPLVYASLLHSDAFAQWEAPTCLTTADAPIAYGRGYAADVQLVSQAGAANEDGTLDSPVVATNDPNPQRNAVTTWSFVYASPNGTPNHYGLVSEIHQTYAPVQIAQGPGEAGQITIEVLGEWFMRAESDGINPGEITWGVTDPETGLPVDPTATVIKVTAGGTEIIALSLNEIVGEAGTEIPIGPVANIMLGEDVRAISAPGAIPDPTSTPTLETTRTAGALDVVRIKALDDGLGTRAADLRIGHFETDLEVPAGGFTCTAATTTTAAPSTSSSSSSSSTSTTPSTAPPTSPSTAPPTTAPVTTTTAPPPPAPVPVPIRIQPRTVG